jgi:hypothetical protein
MEKDAGEIFRELKKDLSAYVELKLELLKLNTYERTGKVIAVLSYGVILLFLAFFAILFIFLALGFFLGDLFGSAGAGFGVVAVLYLLLIGIIVMNKDRISNKVLNVVISALTTNDDKTNATDNEQSATDTSGETDRRRIQQECTIQEQKLNADFSHIQENAGTLLLSGVSALLFPNTKTKSKGTESNQPVHTSEVPSMSLGFADYLSVAQGLLPVAWDVARPLLTAWGIQKVQAWIIKKLFKKKK